MKDILRKIWSKTYIIPTIIATIVIGFVIYFWSLFISNNEINIDTGNSTLWFIVSLLVIAVCWIIIKMSLFQEKIFSKISDLFIKLTGRIDDAEDNIIVLTQELKSDIADISRQLNRSELNDVAERLEQTEKMV